MDFNREIGTDPQKASTFPDGNQPVWEAPHESAALTGSIISQTGASGRELFLRNNLAEMEKPHIYSLETEFAKAKKNRDLLFYLVLAGFILFLSGSTIAIANFLEAKSKQVDIDITDFEDLRLKETLTAAAEVEDELKRKNDELNNLQASYAAEVNKLQQEIQKRANDPQTADKKDLQKLLQQEKKRLETLQKQYEKQIAQKQAEVNKLQEQALKKGLTNKDFQRYYQMEMDRQKKYYEDKLDELKKSYEVKLSGLKNSNTTKIEALEEQVRDLEEELSKLGVVFNDEAIDELVNDLPKSVLGGDTPRLNDYRKELSQEKVLERPAFSDIRARINRFQSIERRLNNLFASNPAAPAIRYMTQVTYSLVNDYEQLWWALSDRVLQKNQTIASYETALYALLEEKKIDGCLTKVEKRDQFGFILRKNLRVKTETIASLYRWETDEYVGKIKLIPTEAGIKAQMEEIAKFKVLRPLDWFKID
ncbi:MAG: hypothetical protein K6U80_17065 [Firmicutes bacterium]|nr:hypothetical protein [Bacillota bacterium]